VKARKGEKGEQSEKKRKGEQKGILYTVEK